MSQFEHLELPKTSIELPRRARGGGGGGASRRDRSSHGQQLITQISGLTQRALQKTSRFHLNPKLIFKIELSGDRELAGKLSSPTQLEEKLSPFGVVLLAQESKANKAIVVFTSDPELTQFKERLETYSSEDGPQYGELDAIEALVPLEPSDRIGRLLELEPVESGETVALDVELWHTGDRAEMREYINDLDDFLREWSEGSDMQVSDQYVGDYLCIARIKVTPDVLGLLLEEDFVKEIDRRPEPSFETPADYNIPLSDLPEVNSPPEQNCGILVIDSGVMRGHPLVAPALGEAEVFPDTARTFIVGGPDDGDIVGGHGTGVSGVAIYGDITQKVKDKSFQPDVWLFSARVTNQNNKYDPDSLLENQLDEAINYFVQNYPNCKVINISLGDNRLTFRDGQKQFRLAAKIDEIAYELRHKNLVFVISAGNLLYASSSGEQLRTDYPNYLFEESAKIIEPATAAIALSVGSISLGTGSLHQYSEDAQRTAITRIRGYPSPFTRIGFGVDGMIKPDLVDFGGDYVIDGKRVIENDPGAAILTLARDFSGSMFRAHCGTSFAAPRVANVAAQLFTLFPNATSNLIRALVASSAILPVEIPNALQEQKKKDKKQLEKQLQIFGYGQPDVTAGEILRRKLCSPTRRRQRNSGRQFSNI